MNKKTISIQQKLLRIVMLTSSVVVFLTCAAFFTYEIISYRDTTKAQLETLAEIVSSNSTAALAFENEEDAAEVLKSLEAEPHVIAGALYDINGKLFAKYPAFILPSRLPAAPATEGYTYSEGDLKGFEPVVYKNRKVGTLYLQSNLKGINARLKLYFVIASAVLMLSIFVAYLLSVRLQRTISEPFLALYKTAGDVSAKQDYTIRARKYDEDELGQLTDSFNQMLEQIETKNKEILAFNQELESQVAKRTGELELANLELKHNNEFVETIINSSVDIIAVFDKQLNYVILNKAAEDLYQVRSEDIKGKNMVEVFPQLTGTQIQHDLIAALKGEIIHTPNYRSRLTARILENFCIPLFDKDQQVDGVLLVGHDITDIVAANEKLSNLNDELEKSNKELEQFAYVASHDLQEPLRKIQTFATMIENRWQDPEEIRVLLGKIQLSAGRMSNLIKAVLNYSQFTNQERRIESVDLTELLDGIISDHELTISEKKAVIVRDVLPPIEGSRLQLNQLLYNLLSNSLKFSNEVPHIRIGCNIINGDALKPEFPSATGGQYLRIIFEDDGIGFDQQYAHKIFTVFQRLHSRKEYPGTGIGLALCKKIVENHHGSITVKSKPGEGSTFTIILPMNQENK
ncbi:HAMP domain-containing protein [Segetibacter sp. 3557_3]|uniref:ATP-binding protein n=1 Tax=Segetibacter sp. 3557_3 TaxID=2547429 RepID=UPI001058AC53|nr:ATP-binding protein [Segetibacter sp. 3557_3]TDH21669.1 HAMP domain-containing protein [Segetibacter sp. 3557_3]